MKLNEVPWKDLRNMVCEAGIKTYKMKREEMEEKARELPDLMEKIKDMKKPELLIHSRGVDLGVIDVGSGEHSMIITEAGDFLNLGQIASLRNLGPKASMWLGSGQRVPMPLTESDINQIRKAIG